ncbi:GNAT family N-acetyltransferase [Streptomyces sp. JJ36]|uniref:GNAT family N-acetyltransferase n=1 Tax=Streptomyces sp. JJ36 TaxID=2736645 RepID=UPI001F1D3CC7|nr:GNAT family N-acetyltransferase [Streptomyces sp. JJ36]MCF6522646.1 GNAT family N-acetyltransferase [Streptomyces sp. JJ36]
MEIQDRYGLTLALVDPGELASEPWLRTGRRLDVVRVPDPPAGRWEELAARGFVRKPGLLTWVAEPAPDEETHLRTLSRLARRNLRAARRRAAEAGLRETVEDPVTPGTLDRFLALYKERVAEMRFGVPFALDHRDAVLHGPRRFFGVFAHEGEELAGGVLALECPAAGALVLRFSAVSAAWRRHSLARVLYFSALREGRARGCTRATLGNEPNLLGHLTEPGLLQFKTALGFRPVPSHAFGDPHATDEADLVLRVGAPGLSDPTVMLGYAAAERGAPLAAHLVSADPAPPLATRGPLPLLGGVTVHAPVFTAPQR